MTSATGRTSDRAYTSARRIWRRPSRAYESDIEDIERSRKQILAKAKQQAEELLKESNKKIENAIREIREKQAEKEETKRIRQELDAFKEEMQDIDTKENDDKIARKIAQIQQRKERHAKRKGRKGTEPGEGCGGAAQVLSTRRSRKTVLISRRHRTHQGALHHRQPLRA